MVMADTTAACEDCKDSSVSFEDNLSERSFFNEVWKWEHRYEFRPGKWAHRDFNFKAPTSDMQAAVTTLVDLPKNTAFEVYEYPGGYQFRTDGDSYARVRMESEEARHDVVSGEGSCRSFSPGARFTMTKHHSGREKGKSYFVTTVRHRMDATGQFTTGSGANDGYENEFTCVPVDAPYRPVRNTERPRIYGTQTAVVVGPAGEEIYPDEFGRVKVQFHWDRIGQHDENSSCWMRVSQVHAGQGWGMMDLPRIGEEVIVSFLEGDPDRPIIVGRVYNGQNMPPLQLAGGKNPSRQHNQDAQGRWL